jgi:hypothetical protein
VRRTMVVWAESTTYVYNASAIGGGGNLYASIRLVLLVRVVSRRALFNRALWMMTTVCGWHPPSTVTEWLSSRLGAERFTFVLSAKCVIVLPDRDMTVLRLPSTFHIRATRYALRLPPPSNSYISFGSTAHSQRVSSIDSS